MDYLEIIKKVEREWKGQGAPATAQDWLSAWRDLAALTAGITHDDARYHPVLSAFERCDAAFEQGDWLAFQQAVERVRQIVHGAS